MDSCNANNNPSWASSSRPTPTTGRPVIPIRLLGGAFNGVLGVTRTSVDTTHQSLLGLNGSVNYTHQIHRWTVAGGFGYSQDAQTVLIAYTTSGYNYTGSVGRRIGRRSYWGAYASGARSLLTGQPGSANFQPELLDLAFHGPVQPQWLLLGVQRECAFDLHGPGGHAGSPARHQSGRRGAL